MLKQIYDSSPPVRTSIVRWLIAIAEFIVSRDVHYRNGWFYIASLPIGLMTWSGLIQSNLGTIKLVETDDNKSENGMSPIGSIDQWDLMAAVDHWDLGVGTSYWVIKRPWAVGPIWNWTLEFNKTASCPMEQLASKGQLSSIEAMRPMKPKWTLFLCWRTILIIKSIGTSLYPIESTRRQAADGYLK